MTPPTFHRTDTCVRVVFGGILKYPIRVRYRCVSKRPFKYTQIHAKYRSQKKPSIDQVSVRRYQSHIGIGQAIPGHRYCQTDTWSILGVFFYRYFARICVYLEGLVDTHRYLTLIGYFKIPPSTTKYFGGNTDPTFGGNRDQAPSYIRLSKPVPQEPSQPV